MTDALEPEALRILREALAVVRRLPLAEVEIVVSSDRAGAVHVRSVLRRADLAGLAAGLESNGGAT